ncbi:MAG: TraR/DksA C4-type zinc finger protein [Actinomycetota bacterium]|nr:TraR/DksA C4-type zinc finger protein [Actinomycetota bacterium]
MATTAEQPPIDEAHARQLLDRERERIEAALADARRLRRGEVEELDREPDMSTGGELIEEKEVDEALERRLRAELEAVERAEKRLEDGTYGFSVQSGEPIPPPRLETIPWAERTAEEQERYERIHGSTL